MKEYLYLWIERTIPKDDLGLKKDFQIKQKGISLSSKYSEERCVYDKKQSSLTVKLKRNECIPNFFSEDLVDIKAVVGKNGVGKTTFLKQIFYQIIEEAFGDVIDGRVDYILIFSENGKISYYQSTHFKCSCKILVDDKNISESRVRDIKSVKAERAVFYTAGFTNAQPLGGFQVQGENDISTTALLNSDKESLYNISMKFRKEVDGKSDSYNSHYTMELIRKVLFIANFYEALTGTPELNLRLPNGIIIAPSNIDIENAIIEITGNNEKKIEKWKEIYKKFKDFKNRFRLAALLNHVRADLSNSSAPSEVKENIDRFVTPEDIKTNGLEKTIELYSSHHLVKDEKKFPADVKNALDLLDKLLLFQKKMLKKHSFINRDSFYFDLTQKQHRDVLKKFLDSYMKIMRLTPFIFMNIRAQSSGEEKFIELFSRMYYVLYMRERLENQHKNEIQNKLSKPLDIHLIIDEADLYLHPEWQRYWLSEFLDLTTIILKKIYRYKKPKIQLLFSTHSPFIITDLPQNNIVLLDFDKNQTQVLNNHKVSPFGANLYDLLSNGFFIKNSIGSFSEKLIENAVRYKRGVPVLNLSDKGKVLNEKMEYVIKSIGDPIIGSLIDNVKKETELMRKK